MMGAVVKGGGSIDYWKMEAAKQSAQLEAAESAAALCSQLAVVNTGDIEPVDRMRVIIAMLTGNMREECISTWSRRVRDHAIRKAGRIDSRMHQIDMTSNAKSGYGAGSTVMGNPKARAAANAETLREASNKYLGVQKTAQQLHAMQVDVQTATAHRTRQGTGNQRRQAQIIRDAAEVRVDEAEDRRFWLRHVQVTQRKLKGLSVQLKEIRGDGDEETYAPRVMRLIMNLWQSQDLIRVVQVWQGNVHARSVKSKVHAIQSMGALRGSATAGVTLVSNPSVFLAHADRQAERLHQAKFGSSSANKDGLSFEAFSSKRDAQARKAQVQAQVAQGEIRSKQGDDRRHAIEPAAIYFSIWWKKDKLRAGKRMLANYFLNQYYYSLWERVETTAGEYFFHKASNTVNWDSRPTEAHEVTIALRAKVHAAEDRADYTRTVFDEF